MTAKYLARTDKTQVQAWLDRYIQSPGCDLTLGSYARICKWTAGLTYREIGEGEDVSAQAVASQIKRDVAKIKAFALSQRKRYTEGAK